MADSREQFLKEFQKSLKEETFVKCTLGNYKGSDTQLQRILIRPVIIRSRPLLSFTYRYKTRDVIKNFSLDETVGLVARVLGSDFFAANLVALDTDFQLEISKKGKSRLHRSASSRSAVGSQVHDRVKRAMIDRASRYLYLLGITTTDGKVKDKQHGKWRQINKFVEIVGSHVEKSRLKDKDHLSIVDMGSGKGYLTFAVFDFFKNQMKRNVTVTGIEARPDLVELCNRVAIECGFENLRFEHGTIADFHSPSTDILIALHACDTATDDALYKGIIANASMIIAAPCCHKEIRKQIKSPTALAGVLKHGTMLERTAEIVTDGMRSLLLEKNGYRTHLFDFVPTQHTPKNNMPAGQEN
ncbi:MAG: SAM-dependent methyltransferase [Acidobacteria bacterium]|nr:SAM-dependent methyltransferase [Acidobacteriota bacterium]